MTKIAIISAHDNIWALPVWQKTIPILQKNGIDIVKFGYDLPNWGNGVKVAKYD